MVSDDRVSKPLHYYKKYDDFLNHNDIVPKTILEIGTYEGKSTKVLSAFFDDAQILSLDLVIRPIDFSSHKNVTYLTADQRDPTQMVSLIKNHFPQGVDLVIEDASHIGYFSKLTFDAVFPLVNSGGAYFVEDWGTGYWDDWVDGSRYQEFSSEYDQNIPKRIVSHDFGMVGFIKSLVDLTHESSKRDTSTDKQVFSSRVRTLEVSEGVCMLVKS